MNTIKNFFRLVCLVASAMILSHALKAQGATATVLVGSGGLFFTPATTNIAQHDSVVWSWSGSFHSSTSGTTSGTTAMPDGLWDSGVNNAGHLFTNTFNSSGTFPYYCSIHFNSGMKGTIVVAASVPPTVTITNPANGVTLSAPASFTLAASATNAAGTVTNVQFFQNAGSLGNVAAAPFSIPVNNLSAADYTFSAVASDNGGLTATNSIIVHVVTANPVTISAPTFVPPKKFQFNYSVNTGLTYVVQASSNLANWNSLATNTAATSPVSFTDTNASGGAAFYRVGRLPNP